MACLPVSSISLKGNTIISSELVWRFYPGSATICIPLTKDQPSPLVGKVILLDIAHRFSRDAHGLVREEGDNCLASQISQINPSDQWGDRCCSQITFTSITIISVTPCLTPHSLSIARPCPLYLLAKSTHFLPCPVPSQAQSSLT